jgi:hypothetical protein
MTQPKHKIVPSEPTDEMIEAGKLCGCQQHSHEQHIYEVYKAMLASCHDVSGEVVMNFGEKLDVDNHNHVIGVDTGRLVAKFSHEAEAVSFVNAYNNQNINSMI